MNEEERERLVRDGYDAIADRYLAGVVGSRPHGPSYTRTIEWVHRLIARLPARATVLDVGCGPGLPVTAMLADAGHLVTGVDVSPRQIELARVAVPAAAFIASDVRDLEWSVSLDAVVVLYAISHLPRGEHCDLLRTIRRWLRPGGWLLINLACSGAVSRIEHDFLGYGVDNWTSSWDLATNERVLIEAGFEECERAVAREPMVYGGDDWLWVLARRSRHASILE